MIRAIDVTVDMADLGRDGLPVLHIQQPPDLSASDRRILGEQPGRSLVDRPLSALPYRHQNYYGRDLERRTLPAIEAARAAGLLADGEANLLTEAWGSASHLRNAGMLWRGRPVESVTTDARDADGIARIIGRGPGEGGLLVDTYLRIARQARVVVDRRFYAHEE